MPVSLRARVFPCAGDLAVGVGVDDGRPSPDGTDTHEPQGPDQDRQEENRGRHHFRRAESRRHEQKSGDTDRVCRDDAQDVIRQMHVTGPDKDNQAETGVALLQTCRPGAAIGFCASVILRRIKV